MRATESEFRHRFWVIAAVFTTGFSAYFLDHRNIVDAVSGGSRPAAHVVLAMGAVLILAAAALRTWAAAYLRTTVVKDEALHVDRLVADGPYRHLRNPLYFGTFLLSVGFGLMASRLGFVLMVGGMLIVLLRLIGREEAALATTQGAGYAAYRAAVPALWPAWRPRVPASGAEPAWKQAVLGELAMWAFGIGAAVFAATFDQRVLYAFLAIGLIGYLPGKRTGGAS